jgi:hypothetical protein
MQPIIIIGDMDKIYLDIMVHGRFYKQIPYEHSTLFKIDYNDIIKYVLEKCPSLTNKTGWSIIEGKRVFR